MDRIISYYGIITGEIQIGDEGPCAVNSEFGWLICGRAKTKNSPRNETMISYVVEQPDMSSDDVFVTNEQRDLTEMLGKFWNTEAMGIMEETDVGKMDFCKT